MSSKTNQTVYVRKGSQAVLKQLSEKTRLSQSEILANWLSAIEVVMNRFSDLSYDRLSFASYPTERKEVKTLLAPIISGEVQFQLDNTSESVNEARADHAVTKDLERIAQKAKVN